MQLDEFFPYILAEVPGCPDITARLALVQAAIEFCNKTLAWNQVLDPIALNANQKDYDLDVPPSSRLELIESVFCDGWEMKAATTLSLQMWLPDWQTAKGNIPRFYNSPEDRFVLRVYPTPTEPGPSLRVKATFIPVSGASVLPDFLGHYYMEAMASGTKARLMAMPGTEWVNPQLAGYHKGEFNKAVDDTRITQLHERVQGSMTVPSRRFT